MTDPAKFNNVVSFLWFLAKNKHDGKLRAVSELQLVLAA